MKVFLVGATGEDQQLMEHRELGHIATSMLGRTPSGFVNVDLTIEAYKKDHPDLTGALLVDRYALQYIEPSEECTVIFREEDHNMLLPALIRSLQFHSDYYVWILGWQEDGQLIAL
jgi:hypothetical protein